MIFKCFLLPLLDTIQVMAFGLRFFQIFFSNSSAILCLSFLIIISTQRAAAQICTYNSCLLYEVLLSYEQSYYSSTLPAETPGFIFQVPGIGFETENKSGLAVSFTARSNRLGKLLASGAYITQFSSYSGTLFYRIRAGLGSNFRISPSVGILQQTLVETSSAGVAGVNSVNTLGPGLKIEWANKGKEITFSASAGSPMWAGDTASTVDVRLVPSLYLWGSSNKIGVPLFYQTVSGTATTGAYQIQNYGAGVLLTIGVNSGLR